MLAISKIIGFENSKTPHNGFKSCFEWYKFCFSGLVFLRFRPKIDRFLVVSCDVLKQCEESVTIIDGGCARFARNIYCKIFIILAYSQYRRYKYSSCTPPGCYEICCYLFSEGTLMRPGYRRGIPLRGIRTSMAAVYASTTFSSTSWRMHISPYTTSLQYTRSTDIHHARLIPRRGCRCDNRGLRSIPSA